jgi:hypothetical protein
VQPLNYAKVFSVSAESIIGGQWSDVDLKVTMTEKGAHKARFSSMLTIESLSDGDWLLVPVGLPWPMMVRRFCDLL